MTGGVVSGFVVENDQLVMLLYVDRYVGRHPEAREQTRQRLIRSMGGIASIVELKWRYETMLEQWEVRVSFRFQAPLRRAPVVPEQGNLTAMLNIDPRALRMRDCVNRAFE